MLIQMPRGTKDIYGAEAFYKQWIEDMIREVCSSYGAGEIRTPIFEHTELFVKNIGDTTDIVNKEMYTFTDKGDRSITLRPEGTAGVARSFVEHKMYGSGQINKFYYIENMFRYEKPQAGRYREFSQFGVEFLGSYAPACDAEVISLAYEVLKRIGVDDVRIKINSLGGAESRSRYHEALKDFLRNNYDGLCQDCKARFDKNPLRVLDCKKDNCENIVNGAPSILDLLIDEDKEHFNKVQEILTAMGIPFLIDPKIVRGLDYYTRTVFEIFGKDIGAQSTLCGGGRYDNLIKLTGGPDTGAVGFAMGMDRLLMVIEDQLKDMDLIPACQVFIGSIGEAGFLKSQSLCYELRKAGIYAEMDIQQKSVKAQLKYADKIKAKYSLILGDTEIETDKCQLKEMATGEVKEVMIKDLAQYLKQREL